MPSKVSHIVVDSVLYDVQKLTADTQAQFVKMVPSSGIDVLLKNPTYKDVKKVKNITI
ncbi:MAG: hypothetical protein ABOK23_05025 [Candidatus Methanoperedens sp.]|nr:hypothetical protein [Candidatus Methanoperedens sp.]MCZ7395052.1 hypothetical protein [Candidatus Methanoperedens sp.]